jgi:hypothetical protein
MIDLSTIRAELRGITTVLDQGYPQGGFLSVSDWSSASDAIENGNAVPPAAYVSLAREAPDPNRLSSGGRAQRVRSQISALFCLAAERADDERADPVEIARGSIIQKLTGFVPGGAVEALSYAGYALRAEGDGLVWGEVLFSTSWDLRGPA